MSEEISDKNKTILTGRIYPALQSCVSNRYKIIVGYFAVVGFLLIDKEKLKELIASGSVVFLAIIFTFFVVHNSVNYCLNAKEQQKREGQKEDKFPLVDILSSVIMSILIWIGYCFLRLHANSA